MTKISSKFLKNYKKYLSGNQESKLLIFFFFFYHINKSVCSQPFSYNAVASIHLSSQYHGQLHVGQCVHTNAHTHTSQ